MTNSGSDKRHVTKGVPNLLAAHAKPATLFRLARLSADLRAVSRGPKATGKRIVRKSVGRAWGRSGIPTLATLTLPPIYPVRAL
jgi:hypothetical protein